MTVIDELNVVEDAFFERVNLQTVPKHVALIMDGNRRWAENHCLPKHIGHWRGISRLRSLIEGAKKIGVKQLSLFAFSTENWKRDPAEVEWLMHLLKRYVMKELKTMLKLGVRLSVIGNIDAINPSVSRSIQHAINMTRDCKEVDLVLAINYGGRDEILRATKSIINDVQCGRLKTEELTEELFTHHLDRGSDCGFSSPDLLIRTAGEMRVSNFMLWQLAYSEFVVSDVLWPDFGEADFFRAVIEFQSRNRRFGGS